MLAACIGVFPSVEPPNLLRSFSASVSLHLPFRQPSSGIQRLCCIKLALLLHIFLGFFKRMENAHRHTLVPQFGFRYKLTKVYSLCLLLCFFLPFSLTFLRIVTFKFCRHSQSQHRHYFAFHALLGAACLRHRAALLRLQFRLQPPAPLLAVLACSASLRAVFGSACASFSVAAVLSSAVGSFSFSSLYIASHSACFRYPQKAYPAFKKT